MKIKIKMRYYYTATRIAKIKKTNNIKGFQECGPMKTIVLYWLQYKLVHPLCQRSTKSKYVSIQCTNNFTWRCIFKWNRTVCLPEDMYKNIWEITQMFIDSKTDRIIILHRNKADDLLPRLTM